MFRVGTNDKLWAVMARGSFAYNSNRVQQSHAAIVAAQDMSHSGTATIGQLHASRLRPW